MLPTLWADFVQAYYRKDEGLGTLRFYTLLPEGAIEVSRIQMSGKQMQRTVAMLSRLLERSGIEVAPDHPSEDQEGARRPNEK